MLLQLWVGWTFLSNQMERAVSEDGEGAGTGTVEPKPKPKTGI